MTALRGRPHLLLVVLLAAVGSKRAFVPAPMPPRRHIPTVTLPVLGLSTQGGLAVEAAKEGGPQAVDTGLISATPFLTVFINLLGFSLAALYVGLKDDAKEVKEMIKDLNVKVKDLNVKVNDSTAKVNDLTAKVNAVILLVAVCTGVSGYAALKP